jgi:hypothetical protein
MMQEWEKHWMKKKMEKARKRGRGWRTEEEQSNKLCKREKGQPAEIREKTKLGKQEEDKREGKKMKQKMFFLNADMHRMSGTESGDEKTMRQWEGDNKTKDKSEQRVSKKSGERTEE